MRLCDCNTCKQGNVEINQIFHRIITSPTDNRVRMTLGIEVVSQYGELLINETTFLPYHEVLKAARALEQINTAKDPLSYDLAVNNFKEAGMNPDFSPKLKAASSSMLMLLPAAGLIALCFLPSAPVGIVFLLSAVATYMIYKGAKLAHDEYQSFAPVTSVIKKSREISQVFFKARNVVEPGSSVVKGQSPAPSV